MVTAIDFLTKTPTYKTVLTYEITTYRIHRN